MSDSELAIEYNKEVVNNRFCNDLRRTKTKGRALNAFCRIAGTNYPIEGLPFREKFLSKKFAVIMI